MTLTHRFVCRRVMAGWTSASAEVEQSLHLVQSPQHTHGEDNSSALPLQMTAGEPGHFWNRVSGQHEAQNNLFAVQYTLDPPTPGCHEDYTLILSHQCQLCWFPLCTAHCECLLLMPG